MAHIKRIKAGTSAQRGAWTPGGSGELWLDTDLLAGGTANALFGGGATLPAGGLPVVPTPAAAPVTTVFGRAGVVAANAGDYNAGQITVTSSGNLASVTSQAAFDEHQGDIDALNTAVAANTAAVGALGATYQVLSEKGNANGYAALDAGGKVPSAQLPAVALTNVFPHATIAARDADLANMQSGDVSVVAADSKTYMVDQAGTGFIELASPGLAGVTFNGRAGPTLAPANGDYTAVQITNVPAGNLAGVTQQAVNDELQTDVDTRALGTVTITGTNGLSGGGDLTANRTISLDVASLTTVTTHDGAADFVMLQTPAGPRKILINDLMNAN